MGLSVSDAVRLFLRRVVVDQAFPLELKVPNAQTQAAIAESRAVLPRHYWLAGSALQLFVWMMLVRMANSCPALMSWPAQQSVSLLRVSCPVMRWAIHMPYAICQMPLAICHMLLQPCCCQVWRARFSD